ncbi:MAG TPA: hypothetical protein VD907_04710 [Verrucomicrobiae bacterium]|nr:hypothetical protein [Verrucomicrobiae bacterium]
MTGAIIIYSGIAVALIFIMIFGITIVRDKAKTSGRRLAGIAGVLLAGFLFAAICVVNWPSTVAHMEQAAATHSLKERAEGEVQQMLNARGVDYLSVSVNDAADRAEVKVRGANANNGSGWHEITAIKQNGTWILGCPYGERTTPLEGQLLEQYNQQGKCPVI